MPSNEIMSMEWQLVGMPLAGPESFSQQQLDYLKRALGVDETVLYDGSIVTPASSPNTISLSETLDNFERVRFYIRNWSASTARPVLEFDLTEDFANFPLLFGYSDNTNRSYFCMNVTPNAEKTILTCAACDFAYVGGNQKYTGSSAGVYKIVGIKRIAGGN